MASVLEAPSASLAGESPRSSLATLPEVGDWGGDRCPITSELGPSASPDPEWAVAAPTAVVRFFQVRHPAEVGYTKAVSSSLQVHCQISCDLRNLCNVRSSVLRRSHVGCHATPVWTLSVPIYADRGYTCNANGAFCQLARHAAGHVAVPSAGVEGLGVLAVPHSIRILLQL